MNLLTNIVGEVGCSVCPFADAEFEECRRVSQSLPDNRLPCALNARPTDTPYGRQLRSTPLDARTQLGMFALW